MKKSKKIRQIKPRYNRGIGSAGELNIQASLTIQEESLSIRQILNRSIQGIEYTNFKTPYYEDEAQLSNYEFNKINNMDSDDKLRLYAEISEKTKTLSEEINTFNVLKAEELKKQQIATQNRVKDAQGDVSQSPTD